MNQPELACYKPLNTFPLCTCLQAERGLCLPMFTLDQEKCSLSLLFSHQTHTFTWCLGVAFSEYLEVEYFQKRYTKTTGIARVVYWLSIISLPFLLNNSSDPMSHLVKERPNVFLLVS
ncbi:hypothetical protein GOODEAATRI_011635 [Goodea atripinnis]|uniref:Uncharacterized protein n=1 Tax=Goodea atripinnis TaxID=208336 RepID=A0ABV0PX70_9TELE